jgi:hypothetical protein
MTSMKALIADGTIAAALAIAGLIALATILDPSASDVAQRGGANSQVQQPATYGTR